MTKERPTHLCSLEIDPRDPSAIIQAQADRIAELTEQAATYGEVVNLVWSASMLMNPIIWRDMIRERARVALNIP